MPRTRLDVAKMTLLVTAAGVAVSALALLKGSRPQHVNTPQTTSIRQQTTGNSSPAIANVSGSVTINGDGR
jgi:hypothetical protein